MCAVHCMACAWPATFCFPAFSSVGRIPAVCTMHYMVAPDRESPCQLRQRVHTTCRGLPPIAEARNWSIQFRQFQLDSASIDHEHSQQMMLTYMVKLHLLPIGSMWSRIIHSIRPVHWADWQTSLYHMFGVTWPELKRILDDEFHITDPELLSSDDQPA